MNQDWDRKWTGAREEEVERETRQGKTDIRYELNAERLGSRSLRVVIALYRRTSNIL